MISKIVRINDKTHQDDIPASRCGIVITEVSDQVYDVLFPETGSVLKFHAMFLEEVHEEGGENNCVTQT